MKAVITNSYKLLVVSRTSVFMTMLSWDYILAPIHPRVFGAMANPSRLCICVCVVCKSGENDLLLKRTSFQKKTAVAMVALQLLLRFFLDTWCDASRDAIYTLHTWILYYKSLLRWPCTSMHGTNIGLDLSLVLKVQIWDSNRRGTVVHLCSSMNKLLKL